MQLRPGVYLEGNALLRARPEVLRAVCGLFGFRWAPRPAGSDGLASVYLTPSKVARLDDVLRRLAVPS